MKKLKTKPDSPLGQMRIGVHVIFYVVILLIAHWLFGDAALYVTGVFALISNFGHIMTYINADEEKPQSEDNGIRVLYTIKEGDHERYSDN